MRFLFSCALAGCCGMGSLLAADWTQWRGPGRAGVDPQSPALIRALPESGLPPLWKSSEKIEGGFNGGWACPVIFQERVYIHVHIRSQRPGVKLPPEKYPSLTDARRAMMKKEEADAHDKQREAEQRERRKLLYEYREGVYCLDAKTGKTVWKALRPSAATQFCQSGTPVIADGKLYYFGADRTLSCLALAEAGRSLWETPLPAEKSDRPMSASCAVAGGVVAVQAGELFAVDAETGKLRWTGDKRQGGNGDSSPAVWKTEGRELLICHVHGDTICVDPADGRELWRVKTQAGRSSPVVHGDLLITLGGSRQGGLRCYEMALTGAKQRWIFRGVADPGASPVVVGEHVYAVGENRLACVGLKDGRAAWQTTLDISQPKYTSLVAADGQIFYVFDSVLSFAADPKKFTPLMHGKIDEPGRVATEKYFRRELKFDELEKQPNGQQQSERKWNQLIGQHGPIKCSTPALLNGRLYIRRNSDVVCYDLRREASSGVSTTQR